MKLYKDTDDLPEWFDVRKYACISELSNSEIKKQVQYRAELITSVEWAYSENETDENGELCFFEYSENKRYQQITKGEVVLIQHRDLEMERISKEQDINNGLGDFKKENYRLPRTQAVTGLSTMSAYHHLLSLMNDELININDKFAEIKNELMVADMNMAAKIFGAFADCDCATVNLNLKEHTNKEIIADITKLLPEWRKCLAIEEPDA